MSLTDELSSHSELSMTEDAEKSAELPTKVKDWKLESAEVRKKYVQRLVEGFPLALADRNLGPERLADELLKKIEAKKVSWQKLKGQLPQHLDLGPGYRVVTPTERIEWVDPETGTAMVADPGETLVEVVTEDNGIQLKTLEMLLKIWDLQGKDKKELEVSGGVFHLHHNIPEPKPTPTEFLADHEKAVIDAEVDDGDDAE